MRKIEDEIHFLLICPTYEEIREQYISSKFLKLRNEIRSNKFDEYSEHRQLKESRKLFKLCLSKKSEKP